MDKNDCDLKELNSKNACNLRSALSKNFFDFQKEIGKNLKMQLHAVTLSQLGHAFYLETQSTAEHNADLFPYKFIADLNQFHEYDDIFSRSIKEKSYIDMYNSFEAFISKCFCCVYYFFPYFLVDSKDKRVTVHFDDIFNNTDIEICKTRIIEQKVKDIIQSSTIRNAVEKLSTYGAKIPLLKSDLDTITLISNNRHILIHNNGVVNNIYIQNLLKEQITPLYAIEEDISEKLSEVITPHSKHLEKIGKSIFESLSSEIKGIYYYHKSKLF